MTHRERSTNLSPASARSRIEGKMKTSYVAMRALAAAPRLHVLLLFQRASVTYVASLLRLAGNRLVLVDGCPELGTRPTWPVVAEASSQVSPADVETVW